MNVKNFKLSRFPFSPNISEPNECVSSQEQGWIKAYYIHIFRYFEESAVAQGKTKSNDRRKEEKRAGEGATRCSCLWRQQTLTFFLRAFCHCKIITHDQEEDQRDLLSLISTSVVQVTSYKQVGPNLKSENFVFFLSDVWLLTGYFFNLKRGRRKGKRRKICPSAHSRPTHLS